MNIGLDNPAHPRYTRIRSYSECAFIDKSVLLSLKFYNMHDVKYSMLAR